MLVDRGYQTTTTEGTGPLQLLPPPTGLAALSARGDGPVFYEILAPEDGIWEIGQGIVTGNQLERVTVLSNSNGTTGLINLPAGEKLVFSVLPASRAVYVDETGALAGADLVTPVPRTRRVDTGAGLAGGGSLDADRTLSVDIAGTPTAVDTTGSTRLLVHDTAENALRAVTRDTLLADHVPDSRRVIAGGLVTGGGALDGDVTVTVTEATTAEMTAGTAAASVATPRRVKGAIDARLATTAEMQTGTNTTKLATPAGVKAAINALSPVTAVGSTDPDDYRLGFSSISRVSGKVRATFTAPRPNTNYVVQAQAPGIYLDSSPDANPQIPMLAITKTTNWVEIEIVMFGFGTGSTSTAIPVTIVVYG
ncbi:MAG: hypothetical protein CMO30_19110 [Tistrella sp.]|uniref:Uncharacterized protein n=1 Tax=Tistrella mobilis TaxID=171437 RepID=A0A3B9IJZ6_9PROT|nr:hypothetical protein [Tistrella sp.]MAD35102.1 hypothetical protein [Tistrella sp.]MBA77384.1 hypothetical protein [Tistrella sp.]HAE47539.1 hypothetical protein [Tistrella mobilis]